MIGCHIFQHGGEWICIKQEGGEMSNKKKQPMPWGMTYQQCLQSCIENVLLGGDVEAAALYRGMPLPTERVWSLCLQEVAEEPTEDLSNPFHVIARYELRLFKRGLPTVLGQHAFQVKNELQAAAQKVGVPAEFIPNAVSLIIESTPISQPRDRTKDN